MPRFTTSPEAVRRMSPDVRETLMARSQAAREYINRCMGPNQRKAKEVELVAFMSIFHPDWSDDRVRKLRRAMR